MPTACRATCSAPCNVCAVPDHALSVVLITAADRPRRVDESLVVHRDGHTKHRVALIYVTFERSLSQAPRDGRADRGPPASDSEGYADFTRRGVSSMVSSTSLGSPIRLLRRSARSRKTILTLLDNPRAFCYLTLTCTRGS